MRFMPWLVILYALIILAGGVIGFSMAHSWPSIIMGTITAIILILLAIAMFKGSMLGYFTAVAVAFILTVFFTNRFIHTFKFMPGGLMAVISFLVFLILVVTKIKS